MSAPALPSGAAAREAVLVARDLAKSFGGVDAVQGVSFSV